MLVKDEIKQKLNLKDNIYLDKYLQLIQNNLNTKYKRYNTQVHHIIPKYYYRENNLKINESLENKVNLLYTDHLKAHCYLALCSNNQVNIYGNFCAIVKLLGNNIANKYNVTYFTLEEFLNSLDENQLDIQQTYREYKMHRSEIQGANIRKYFENLSEDELLQHKQRYSEVMSLRITIYKDDMEKRVKESELDDYLNNGWKLGRNPNMIEKMSNSLKGRNAWNKGVPMSSNAKDKWKAKMQLRKEKGIKNKPCSEERKKAVSVANKGRIYIHKNNVVKSIHEKDLDFYLNDGWLLGNPNAANCTGKICINDGKKNYMVNELQAEKMILSGKFFKGSCKESKVKNSIWINNGKCCKRISVDDLNSYLAEGWVKGFLNTRWLKDKKNNE